MALTDKVAVVIGATGQLGPAVARAFADAGARLVLVGSQANELAALFKEIGYPESRVVTHPAEALNAATMQALAASVEKRFGRADILLHILGGYRAGGMLDTPDETWELMLDVNLRSAVWSIRAFLPLLTANGWGRILTISSGVTQSPPPMSTAYVTAKAALETMTIALAQEVKDKGVTANVVLVRALDTPAERARHHERKNGWVRPDDVAATLLFLCSDAAGAITGARIPVSGGI